MLLILAPQVTWGTSPEQVVGVGWFVVPAPESFDNKGKRLACEGALKYMDLAANTKMTDIEISITCLLVHAQMGV